MKFRLVVHDSANQILKVTSSVEPRDLRHELKRGQQLEDSMNNGSVLFLKTSKRYIFQI